MLSSRWGNRLRTGHRWLSAAALTLLATLNISSPQSSEAAIRAEDMARIGKARLVAPAEGAKLAETAVRFAFEVPSGWTHPRLIVSRYAFDPSGWTEVQATPDRFVREVSEGVSTLADAGVQLDADAKLYWAVALEEKGTGRLRISDVRSFEAQRKFTNRVAPSPLLLPSRVGTLSPAEVASQLAEAEFASHGAPRVRLQAGYEFAPSEAVPAVPAELSRSQRPLAEAGEGSGLRSFLVQFSGTPSAPELAAIAKAGGAVFCYVPDQAYLVRMTDEARTRLTSDAKPAWVGEFLPAYKVSPRIDRTQVEKAPYATLLFPDADVAAVRAAMSGLGLDVFDVSDNGINKMIRFRAPGSVVAQVAGLSEVAWVEPVVTPEFSNSSAQWVVQTNASNNRRIWDLGIRGQGQVVMTSDSGVRVTHDQFRDNAFGPIGGFGDFPTHRKIIAYKLGSANPLVAFGDHSGASYHGTHTAGTITGNDDPTTNLSLLDGVAKEAKLYFMDISGPSLANSVDAFADLNDLFLPPYVGNAGGAARVSSHSWGANVAGAYDLNALNVDQFMWAHPDFFIAFSNGNAGAIGSVGSPATAKNCASIGGTANGASTGIYASTSRGPAADGRRKPTFAAPGLSVNSARGLSDGTYQILSGTSMASPGAAGAVTLIRQYLADGWYPTGAPVPANGFAPSAALLKAMAINGASANVTGTAAPDNNVGWGKISADSVLYFTGDIRKLLVVDHTAGLGNTQFIEYQINVVDNTMPLEVSLCWTDYPGSPAAAVQLVNDLNLTVSQGATVYRGNVYAGTVSTTGGVFDNRNVEEAVRIVAPPVGIWTVRVTGLAVPQGPQAFGLAITGGIGDQAGALAMDRSSYGSTGTVELQVIDNNAVGPVQVNVASTTEATPEVVTLAGGNGVFTGTIALTPNGVTNGNSVLSVSHGDQVSATYLDAAPSATLVANASVIFTGPVITNVHASSAGDLGTQITWNTDINASTKVYYGATPALELGSVTTAGAPLGHSALLTGLTAGTTYYYDVESTSLDGVQTRDDKGGSHYQFTAKASGDILLVIGDDAFDRTVAWTNALNAGGYDFDVWNGALGDNPPLGNVNKGLRSYKAVLWQPGIEQYPPYTDVARDTITEYLNGGGRMLAVGHDVAWSMGDAASPVFSAARQAWLSNTLKTVWLEDPLTWTLIPGVLGDPISNNYVAGIPYTPVRDGAAGDEININQTAGGFGEMTWRNSDTSPDSIGFRWTSSTNNGSAATAYWGGLPSRLATMYFEFVQLDPPFTSASATRTDVLDKTIQWLFGREKPTVAITAPNGGEVITTSSTNVTWNESVGLGRAVASRRLDYSVDGGQTWTLIATGVGPSPYNWNLASVPNSPTVLVRVRNVDDGTPALAAQDVSNATFTLNRTGGDLQGPVVVAGTIVSSPNPLVRPNPGTLTATVSDASTGGSNVSAAEWSYGPTPATAGSGNAMTGAFGTPTVSVSGNLDTTPMDVGAKQLWVRAQDSAGNWGAASVLNLQINGTPNVGVDDTPTVAFLRQNVPNPFGSGTVIRFGLPTAGHVELGIYDVQGRTVKHLVAHTLQAGVHSIQWDGRSDDGSRVRPGVYYYRLQTPGARFEKRLVALD